MIKQNREERLEEQQALREELKKKLTPFEITTLKIKEYEAGVISWQDMKAFFRKEFVRFNNMNLLIKCPTHKAFKSYGGRGLKLDPDWQMVGTQVGKVTREPSFQMRKNFINFLSHVGMAPNDKDTLDRVNNEIGYVKGNLAWKSQAENSLNKRGTVKIGGIPLKKLCRALKFSYPTALRRLKKGVPVEELFNRDKGK